MPTRAQLKRQAEEEAAAAAAAPPSAAAAAVPSDPPPPEEARKSKKKGKAAAKPPSEAAAEETEKAAAAAAAEVERARAQAAAIEAATPVPSRSSSAAAAAASSPAFVASANGSPPPPPPSAPPATPVQAALSQDPPPSSEAALAKSASLSQDAPPPSPGAAPMSLSMASASQGTVEGVEAGDVSPMSMTFYDVNATFSDAIGYKLNELLPSMAWQRGIPWSALKPHGQTTPIVAFTVNLTPESYTLTETPDLSDEEFAKIALVGVFVLYTASNGQKTLRILDIGTRNDLRPSGAEGYVEDPYLAFAIQQMARHVSDKTKTTDIVVTIARNQRPWLKEPRTAAAAAAAAARGATAEQLDAEYLTVLGTLTARHFAYSRLNAKNEYVQLRLGPEGSPAIQRWSVYFNRTKSGLDAIEYSYAPPAESEAESKVIETEIATFTDVQEVQRFSFPLMKWIHSETVVLHAPLAILTGDEDDLSRFVLPKGPSPSSASAAAANAAAAASAPLPDRIDVTIPIDVAANAPLDNPRRGGRRKTYRKKARKGKTAKRRR